MKLPTRQRVGSTANMRRSQRVQERLMVIGKEYRAAVPNEERSYRRWLEFLYEREPSLVMGSPADAYARFVASLAHRAGAVLAKNLTSPRGA